MDLRSTPYRSEVARWSPNDLADYFRRVSFILIEQCHLYHFQLVFPIFFIGKPELLSVFLISRKYIFLGSIKNSLILEIVCGLPKFPPIFPSLYVNHSLFNTMLTMISD
uniref:Uncharacterized protein n=1 Tax=Naja naja TaxID=35670 RepID=A0A8C6VA30_NAJNA